MTFHHYQRLCLITFCAVIVLCSVRTVKCDDSTDSDDDGGIDNPNINYEDENRPNETAGNANRPNANDSPSVTTEEEDTLADLGLEDSDNTSNTANTTTGVPKIPHESPVAGTNTSEPPSPTSTTTTVAELGAAVSNFNENVTTVRQSSTGSAGGNWWQNLFGSGNTANSNTSPAMDSTTSQVGASESDVSDNVTTTQVPTTEGAGSNWFQNLFGSGNTPNSTTSPAMESTTPQVGASESDFSDNVTTTQVSTTEGAGSNWLQTLFGSGNTSNSTTSPAMESTTPQVGASESDFSDNVTTTQVSTTEGAGSNWWQNLFGSGNTANSTTSPSVDSTTPATDGDNSTSDDSMLANDDPENSNFGTDDDNATSSTETDVANLTTDNSTLTSPWGNTTGLENSTSSNETTTEPLLGGLTGSGEENTTLSPDSTEDNTTTGTNIFDLIFNNSTNATDSTPLANSTTANDNSTLPNGTDVENDNSTVSNASNADNSTELGNSTTPSENATTSSINLDNSTTQADNSSTGSDNSTALYNSTTPSENTSISSVNETSEDNSTLGNGTNVDNTTLPTGFPEENTTLPYDASTANSTLSFGTSDDDNTTTLPVEATTWMTDTTILAPEEPEEGVVPKESLPGGCSYSLGLENGAGRLTASDWSPGFLPEEARLNGRSGWVGGFTDVHYIQAELSDIQGVSGLLLQPHAQWHRNVIQQFRLFYSLDGYHWSTYQYTRNNKTYSVLKTALDEHTSESLHVFNPPLQARFVVINPVRWVGNPGPALRFELFGCGSNVSASTIIAPRVFRGEMQRETTWEAGVPYLVDQMVRIWPGVTFRLLPGVQVYFTNPQAGFLVEGTMVADGTAESNVAFESGNVLSHLTIGPYWNGLNFRNGEGPKPSVLNHVKISGAAIGVEAIANSVMLKDIAIERCETGFRLETGSQATPNVIQNGVFVHNKYGVHIQNVTGAIELSGLHLRDQRVIGINGYFVYEPKTEANGTSLSLSHVTVENSSYAIYLTGYNNLVFDVASTNVYDCHYGIYLDYSDAVPSISTTVRDSNFTKNRVYGLVVDFKHFGRTNWYQGPHTFKTTVTNNLFDTGANGISYYSPEVVTGLESDFLLQSNTFKNLHSGAIVQSYELSSFRIESNRFSDNGGRALDIFYHAIGVKGVVKNNTFENNHAADNANDTDIQNDTLIVLAGNSDAEMHGTLTFTENVITNNSFPHILESSLVSMDMLFNVLENKMADCEMCVTSLWVHGGKTLNASHNWWGTPKLTEATQRVADFYRDMDVAGAEISPILREPRVVGASWDTVPHRVTSGGSITNGGIISGNVTAEANEVLDIEATIYIPEGNVLTILAGSHLRFAKDIGIVVEGQLHIMGTQANPVVMEPKPNALWKGIRLAYANATTFSHVTITQSRGIESSGSIPRLDSAILRQSTGPGLWITVIQPPPMEIRGVAFENGEKDGVLLEVQGDGTAEVSISIVDCHIVGNNGTGVIIRAGNVIANLSLDNNVVANNSQDGVRLELSNGRIKMADNDFRSSHPGGTSENNRLVHVTFDGRCMPNAVRDIEITRNVFSELNVTTTPGSVLLETPCIDANTTSQWNVADNTFSVVGPTVPGDESMLKLSMADNTDEQWPLQIQITNNSFTCMNQVGSSLRLLVAHGESVNISDNHIVSCDAPLLVESRYLKHELTIMHNMFEKTGPIVLQSVESVANESLSSLNFSYNEVAGSSGEHEAVVKTTGYNASLHYNFFENPNARHDLWVGDMAPVNATLNWWGTPDFNRILARVFDGRTDYSRAQADIFPCLLSRNYTNISTANPDVFQITDNVIGGSVHGNITLPHSNRSYEVEYPIRVPAGSSLTIPGGTTLIFHNHTGIFADGQLNLEGNSSAWITMIPANDTTSWRGVTIGKPREEFMRVRLSGSRLAYTGRVEAYVSGVWRGVCADGFNMAAAHVVCKELSFFDAESTKEMDSSQTSFGVSDVKCTGLEISLLDCNVRTGLEAKCKSGKTPIVVCQENNDVLSRSKRATSIVSDNHPTSLKFTRITEADVGLQVNDDDGIELVSMSVTSSKGPSIVLSSRGAMGVHLIDCIVAHGGDIGIDVAGSCSITMTGTNVTSNKLAGVNAKVSGENSDVHIVDSVIRENGEDGIRVVTDAGFNITGGSITLNKHIGITLDAATVAMYHTIVEEHAIGGVKLNISNGQLSVKNSVFSNNGGNTVDAIVTVRDNGTDNAFIEFEKTGIINGSIPNSANNRSEHSTAVLLHLDAGGATANSSISIPVRFIETHVLDSFGDGILIEDARGELNLTLTECIFEHVEGTAIHVVTNNTAPQLYFRGNQFHHVQNNTLLVDVENS